MAENKKEGVDKKLADRISKFKKIRKEYISSPEAIEVWKNADLYGMVHFDDSVLETPESKKRIEEIKKKYGNRPMSELTSDEREAFRQQIADFMK